MDQERGGDVGQERGGDNVMSGGQVTGAFIQAHSIGKVEVHGGPVPGQAHGGRTDEDLWVRRARGSGVWDHVPPNRDVDAYREAAASVAARLAALRDEAEGRLSGDPWQEPAFAIRFADRVEWLLGEPDDRVRLDLYPAEAALLVLTPFLYRVHALRAAVRRLDVEPWRLEPSGAGHGSDRAAFEAFTDSHGLLVQRALLRRASESPIGWWLFHRWLVQHDVYERSAAVDPVVGLLDELGEPAAALGEALAPRRVSRLLHGLRRGPDVCNPEYLDTLPADDGLRGPGHQRVRDQRLVLLAALAYAASIEMTALPDIVVEHLGIPHAVNLEDLRTALEESGWGGSAELPVLRAECAHEAVIEGLRAYVVRADELLHAVSRTIRERVNQPVPPLPIRLSADGVCPSDSAFTGWASFRLDERRIRDLLMGVQLYKDRDLAVRELYQNALDACRYRRARTEYLDRTHPAVSYTYEGRISFEQGVDGDGRAYVECRDNGIGMGEAELRGVFSNAGARFAEQPDFKEERAAWGQLDPPVKLYPNSRFGIGVLSYFMLADEIEVTTCRMGLTGRPGPVLRVSIFGPGHLFRIARLAEEGQEPGTVVRLYLQSDGGGDGEWSSLEVLRRLLGIAEFRTTAVHEGKTAEWRPGVLAEREGSPYEHGLRFSAHGVRRPWRDAPDGAQVIWCQHGGGLLVDGLAVQSAWQGYDGKTTGAVVNLTGPYAPGRLSVDRTQILDDVSEVVQELLKGALEALCIGDDFPDYRWLAEVAYRDSALADLVTTYCVKKRHRIRVPERYEYDAARAGFLFSDLELLFPGNRPGWAYEIDRGWFDLGGDDTSAPDHILLWRLLAHRPHPLLTELTELCPGLAAVDAVLPALPSDDQLLAQWKRAQRRYVDYKSFDSLLDSVADSFDEDDTDRRAAQLNLLNMPRTTLPADLSEPRDIATAFTLDPELGECMGTRSAPCYYTGEPIHPGDIVEAALALHITVPELCRRLASCGLHADATGLSHPSHELLRLLSEHHDGKRPWLSRSRPVPLEHVLVTVAEGGTSIAAARRKYTRLGFVLPDRLPETVHPDDLRLLTVDESTGNDALDDFLAEVDDARFPRPPLPEEGLQYTRLLAAADALGEPLSQVITRAQRLGFRVALRAPEVLSPFDQELLARRGALSWQGVSTTDAMPFAHVVDAARTLLRQPGEIAARLNELDVRTTCADLPSGLSLWNAQELLSGPNGSLLRANDHVSLQSLLRKAHALHVPLRQVHDWLTQLGIKVDDPADTIRAALPLIPRADP